MATPNASTRIIQQGAFCNVVIYDADDIRATLGLVTNCTYNEDFNVVPALVIGFFGPVSLDAQNYNCSLTIGTFVPLDPRLVDIAPWPDGGTTTIQRLLKTRSQIAISGKGTALSQIDFVDIQAGTIYNSFSQVIITNNAVTIGAAAYVTANIQMLVVERTL